MAFTVYILKLRDGSLYTGQTNNLENRLEKHRKGQGSKYVRSRLPLKLVYTEECDSRSEALQREASIKKMSRSKKLELIQTSKI